MQKLLFRRTLRDLKANAFRYLALFLLTALSMFIVIATVGSAESVITTVNKKAEINNIEDGQFGVFIPLKKKNVKEIEKMGVILEESFYIDFQMSDSSTLRLMKNREKNNLVSIDEGALAKKADEIVIERIYANAHNISVGDTVIVAGDQFEVSGIGTSPDYDLCIRNVTDMSADGNIFGTAFVTPDAYNELLAGGQAEHAEEYRYSYRMPDNVPYIYLKDKLMDIKINPSDVRDTYFKRMLNEQIGDRDSVKGGISALADGTDQMSQALNYMDAGMEDLDDGIQAVYDGIKLLNSQSSQLTEGSDGMLSALRQMESSAGKLTFSTTSAYALRNASASLLDGVNQLNSGLKDLSENINYKSYETALKAVLSQNGVDYNQLSPDAQLAIGIMKAYMGEVSENLKKASDSSESLKTAFEDFDESMDSLPDTLEELNSGLTQLKGALSSLSRQYESLDSGINDYADALKQIYDGYDQIAEGSKSLSESSKLIAANGRILKEGMSEFHTESDDFMEEYLPFEMETLTDFIKAENNPRIKAANDDVEININVGMLAGVIILILITYVISVFVIHSIDSESAMIGALYALGVKKEQLMMHYTMLPVMICVFGGTIGTFFGYSDAGINMMVGESVVYYSIPKIDTVYSPFLLIYGLLVPGFIAFALNRVVISKRLDRSALSLLRKEEPQAKTDNIQLGNTGFIKAFQIRQFLREKRSCFAVLAGMFVSLLIMILGLNCYSLCKNIKVQNSADTKYEYMYQYKYPVKDVPKGGYEAYIEGLNKEVGGYNMEITLIGLTDKDPFFPITTSVRKSEISISDSVAEKYDIQLGDKLTLSDEVNEKEYSFTVKQIVPYSVGLSCFMDIDSMRELFDKDDDYFNAVYSDHKLDIASGRLYSITSKKDIEKSSDIFIEIMTPLIGTMVVVASLIFLIVLYQMMKVMIDRSAVSISLMKIFGYRNGEIRRLYLDGNFIVIAIGALIMIPIAKVLMDAIYPSFVANVACGLDFSWPSWMYAAVYIGLLSGYLLIRTVLMGRLKKLSPAEVLKDRE